MKASKQLGKQGAVGRVWRESPTGDFEHRLNGALGRVIRRWRVEHGFSAYAVAQRAKISRQTLADVEEGDVWFSLCIAARICDAMGLRVSVACAAAERLRVCFSEKKRRL